jgi:hypothetical protein
MRRKNTYNNISPDGVDTLLGEFRAAAAALERLAVAVELRRQANRPYGAVIDAAKRPCLDVLHALDGYAD